MTAPPRTWHEQLLLALLKQRCGPEASPIMPPGYVTRSVAELVLAHGRFYRPGTKRLPLGAPGYCFLNAYRHTGALPYVEGFALHPETGQLLHHAWLGGGDPADLVAVDVTWPLDPEHLARTAYLGIEIPLGLLDRHWRNCGDAHFLTDLSHDNPALQVPYDQWPDALAGLLDQIYLRHCLDQVHRGEARLRPDGSVVHREHEAVR